MAVKKTRRGRAPRTPQASALAAVNLWNGDGARSETPTAAVGRRLLAGEWTTREDAEELGCHATSLSQILTQLRTAGYAVDEESAGGNSKRWRVAGEQALAPVKVEREESGHTHPELGAVLSVRALAMTDDGELAMQLSNGSQMWMATITGHITKGKRK